MSIFMRTVPFVFELKILFTSSGGTFLKCQKSMELCQNKFGLDLDFLDIFFSPDFRSFSISRAEIRKLEKDGFEID